MNVVSLLIASALSAGGPMASPAPLTAAPAGSSAPVVSSAPIGGCGASGVAIGGCASADCGCSSKPGLLDRLRGLFSRRSCGGCDSCASAPAPVVYHAPKASCGCSAPQPACGCDPCSSGRRSGLFSGLFSGFGRKRFHASGCDSCSSCNSCGSTSGSVIVPANPQTPVYGGTPSNPPAKIPATPSKKLPDDAKPKAGGKVLGSIPSTPEITPAGAKSETGVNNPFDLARRFVKRAGHAADYSSLTGQLSYVHADGGLWILRYAPLSEEDTHGGSVILARDSKMKNYREGDLITVEGRITRMKGSSRLGAPLYQVRTISLVDRPLN